MYVIAVDAVKAILSCLVSGYLLAPYGYYAEGLAMGGAAVMFGHVFPILLGFRGGKGILSGLFIALTIDWRIALVVWGGFLLYAVLTKYVSLGSTWAGTSFPFATWYCFPDQPLVIVLGFLCGGLVVWQHRANIKRLLNGTENKFSFHRKKT
jgi:glycerol-3-phosphate acyltransferase PlsY